VSAPIQEYGGREGTVVYDLNLVIGQLHAPAALPPASEFRYALGRRTTECNVINLSKLDVKERP
jgi:hypothetical protein